MEFVATKLLATNLNQGAQYVEQFEVVDHQAFQGSIYTDGGYFVNALYCTQCEMGFMPDEIANDLGIGENQIRGSLLPLWPLGVGGVRSDPDNEIQKPTEQGVAPNRSLAPSWKSTSLVRRSED
ncbi:MAG: hypothetical protein H7Z37_06795 [Pyrinomonadaceae bacterium]|nr:hypothetical protein [Pyrinomonadaceae bacterium]